MQPSHNLLSARNPQSLSTWFYRRVAYAVLSFGGFLGIGSSYHPLPWNELTYDTSLGGYVVNRSKEQLEGAPACSAPELQSWDDAVYSGRVDEYYNGLGGGRMAQP
jgi:hypothetical protein